MTAPRGTAAPVAAPRPLRGVNGRPHPVRGGPVERHRRSGLGLGIMREYLAWAPGGEALVAMHRLTADFALPLVSVPGCWRSGAGGHRRPGWNAGCFPRLFSRWPLARFSSLGEWRYIRALGRSAAGGNSEAADHESGSNYDIRVEARQPDHRLQRRRHEYGRTQTSHR